MNMSLLVLLFFGVSIFGFIFSAALLVRKKPKAYYFFTAVYLIFNFSLLVNLLIALGYSHDIPHIYRLVSPLQFLLGPLCYFFVKATLRPYQKFGRWDWLHFLPFVISFIGLVPIFLLSGEEKLLLIELGKDFNKAWHLEDAFGMDYIAVLRLKFFIFLGYLFFQWKMILDFMRNASSELREKNKILQQWLLFDASIKTVIGVVVFVSAWMERSASLASGIQIGLILIEIIVSAFFLIISPDLLKGVVFQGNIFEGKKDKPLLEEDSKQIKPFDGVDFQEEHQALMLRVEQYLQLEQPFLHPAFSLSDLSTALGLSTRSVSLAIKSTLGIGFPEYINKIRFAFLEQKLLSKPEMLQFSVDALAKSVGFSSRSGFYKAFKKNEKYDSPLQMIEKIAEHISRVK
jgi:AraC-like DNA-binding protein